jgi:cytochrome c oxidase cbb3-type subunit 4
MTGMILLYIFGTFSAIFAFAGICWWAYTPTNKKRFEQDAQLALDSDPLYQKNRHLAGDKSK